MNPLEQLRRLQQQRAQITATPAPEQIHPGLSRGMPATPPTRPAAPLPQEDPRAGHRLEDLVPGEVVQTDAGACYVSTTVYPIDHTHGPLPLGALLAREPARLAPFVPSANVAALPCDAFGRAAVLDIETTGLGGSTSTYAFMVGVGTFEELRHPMGPPGQHFVVRQLFLRSPADEPALLALLHQLLAPRALLMSFNGRSFDVPVLRTRYAVNRPFLPAGARLPALFAEGAPHLDLLQPARRLWRRRLQSCRLINLETHLLGRLRSEDDVPGFLIPELYVAYLRSGRADDMRRIFYHNVEDIVSTAAIAGQVCEVLQQPPAHARLDGRDLLSLGASLEKLQRWDDALDAYRRAVQMLETGAQQREAFKLAAALCKRTRRWDEAVQNWEQWLTTVPGADATPYIELAKYYEWEARDPAQAVTWAAFGLHTVLALPEWQRVPGQLADLERRVARLKKKTP